MKAEKMIVLCIFALTACVAVALIISVYAADSPAQDIVPEEQTVADYGDNTAEIDVPVEAERLSPEDYLIIVPPDMTEDGQWALMPLKEYHARYGADAELPKLQFTVGTNEDGSPIYWRPPEE